MNRLKRVCWRVKEEGEKWVHPELGKLYSMNQIRKAIMTEIGLDKRTVKSNIVYLTQLGYIKRLNRYQVKIMDID